MDYKKIHLSQIPGNGLVLNEHFPGSMFSEFLDDDLKIGEDTIFKGIIRKVSNRYILSGRVESTVELNCDRCLEKFEHHIQEDFMVTFVVLKDRDLSHEVIENEIDGKLEEVIVDSINLIQSLYEQIILQIPIKALCSDGCEGLCSSCGQNLNKGTCDCDRSSIDPRLLKLKDLLEK